MSGWQRVTIKDVVLGLYDGPHATPPPADSGPVFLGIGNVTEDGHLDLQQVRHIAEEDFAGWTKRVTPAAGDIVFTYEATLNRYAIVPAGFRGCLGRRMALIRPDERQVDTRFLFYSFFGPAWRATIEANRLAGATVDRIPLSKFLSFPIDLPELNVQRRISAILGAYDELIEVNRRRVTLLENIARDLFKEWFVRFRFPGHNATILADGALPAGWRQVPIRETYEGLYDGPHATPAPAIEGPVFLGIGNLTETGHLDLTAVRHIAEDDYAAWTKRVTPQEGDVVFTYEATLNRYAIIPKGFRGCLGRRLALIRADASMNRFLYLYFFTEAWRAVIAKNKLSGATVDRISLKRFPDFPVLLPSDEVIERFDAVVRPIFDQIHALSMMNVKLSNSRDLLIPRLISGQLSVATAEQELQNAA